MVHCDRITQNLCDYLTSAPAFTLENSANNWSMFLSSLCRFSISGNTYVLKGIRHFMFH